MAKRLLIFGGILCVVAIGAWGLRAALTPATPAVSSPLTERPVEDSYAPAMLLTADLTSEGELTLSGTATPRSTVSLIVDGQPDQSLKIGVQPQWSLNTKLPPARIRRRVMQLRLSSVLSDDTVIESERGLIILTEPENFSQSLFMTAPGVATRVLQSAFGDLPSRGPMTLEAIDFDDAGGVIVSGKADGPGRIRLQAGGTVIGETGPDASGHWALIAGSVLPVGTYALRLQMIDGSNRVAAQMDVPFTRPQPDNAIIGEPRAVFSESRWTLTRPLSGGGVQHTVIYAPSAMQP